jgi:hypothetical protein
LSVGGMKMKCASKINGTCTKWMKNDKYSKGKFFENIDSKNKKLGGVINESRKKKKCIKHME